MTTLFLLFCVVVALTVSILCAWKVAALSARMETLGRPAEDVLAAAQQCDHFARCQQGQETAIVKLTARVAALERSEPPESGPRV